MDFDLTESAMVNSEQTEYTYDKSRVEDGKHELYAVNIDDTAVYGPILKRIVNGELGDVDFTDVPECTNDFCNMED
jgi:hypothetical protein